MAYFQGFGPYGRLIWERAVNGALRAFGGDRELPCRQAGGGLGRLWSVGGVTATGRGFVVDLVLVDLGSNGSECGGLSELPAL